jgi:hypothetical protein
MDVARVFSAVERREMPSWPSLGAFVCAAFDPSVLIGTDVCQTSEPKVISVVVGAVTV